MIMSESLFTEAGALELQVEVSEAYYRILKWWEVEKSLSSTSTTMFVAL